ncbi:MAG: DUF6702 family protein [Pseudomonadota bacterium]
MMRFLAFVLCCLMALTLGVPAEAHRQKVTISTLAHNPRTGMLEVIHRVPLHDAEHALKQRGDKTPDIINDLPSRRAFARYLASRFSIVMDESPLDLTLLGSEIEGGYLLVYQEAPSPGPGSQLWVNSQVLTEIWARQENRVNIGDATSVETLVFKSGDALKSATLP